MNNYEQNIFCGKFTGYVLFLDIVNFTPICDVFKKFDKTGAEELSGFLSEVLGTPIELIEKFGGFVSHFAGDAFCAVFPDDYSANVKFVVDSIDSFFKKHGLFVTKIGEFAVSIRMTITYGDISWRIFCNKLQNEYVFLGEPFYELAELSKQKNSLALSKKVREDFISIKSLHSQEKFCDFTFTEETLNSFIHRNFIDVKPENEIRDAGYCFINLANNRTEDYPAIFSEIHEKLSVYGGFLNKIDATDKGLVAFILFGIPKSEGSTLDRLCRFALETASIVQGINIGISCGNAFAGYVGNKSTFEYTVLGSVVNLASRLMQKANTGEVISDTFVWQEMNKHFGFEHLGAITLKGIENPVRFYRLGQILQYHDFYRISHFIGREQERSWLSNNLTNAINANNSCILYIYGDPGVGKSRLIREVLNNYPSESYNSFTVLSDAIIQKPLEGVSQIIRKYFYYNALLPKPAGIAMFRGLWASLAGNDSELKRIESIISSLLGYEWEDSVWAYMPESEKKEQLKKAFVLFIYTIAKNKPVIIHLDDGQWLDNESKEFISALNSLPSIFIIMASRYKDTGETVKLTLESYKQYELNLEALSLTEGEILITSILRLQKTPPQTVSFINQKSMGNPMFIEQLTSYLMEQGNIDALGNIKGDIEYIRPFSIADIIGSRIDKLAENIRECLYHASILGMEFNVKILSNMLNRELGNELGAGKAARVWSDLDELRYIFTHVLIKDTVYNRMLSDKIITLHLLAAEAMEKVYKGNERALKENAEEIAHHYYEAKQELKAAKYYNLVGEYYTERCSLEKAEKVLNLALEIRKKNLGDNHPDTVISMDNLANLFYEKGLYALAEPLYLTAMEISEKIFGKEHEEVATNLNNLGNLYLDLGKYEQSENFFLEAIKIREGIYGSDQKELAKVYNDIAMLYHKLNKFEQAETFYLRALRIKESLFGVNNHSTAITINNLGDLYDDLGKYELSELQFLRALRIREELFGSAHPNTANVINNLATLYAKLRKHEQAESFYKSALKIYEDFLGSEHRKVAIVLNNMASLYGHTGKTEAAELAYERVLSIEKKVYGVNHPSYAQTLSNIANSYINQGKYKQAETLQLQALTIFQNFYKNEHLNIAVCMNNLGQICKKQNKYDEAEHFYFDALSMEESILGNEHPSLAGSLANLADFYERQSKFEQAEPLYLRALAITEKNFGEMNPETVSRRNDIAHLYRAQQKYEQAESLFVQIIRISKELLGISHPYYILSINNLAYTYTLQQKYELAQPLYDEALALGAKALGEEHPSFANILFNYADFYLMKENHAKAEELFFKTFTIREKIFGIEHSNTQKTINKLINTYEKIGDIPRVNHFKAMLVEEENDTKHGGYTG